MKINKILVVGAGGIGSYLVPFLVKASQTLPLDITVMDFDIVEEKNLLYQNYEPEDVGKNKAEVLAERYGVWARPERLVSYSQLEGYDLIVLAVDNHEARKIVWKSGKDWVDCRAEKMGSQVYIKTASTTYKKMIKTAIKNSPEYGSCQRIEDIKRGDIHLGHVVSAAIGAEVVINKIRKLLKSTDGFGIFF